MPKEINLLIICKILRKEKEKTMRMLIGNKIVTNLCTLNK